MSTKRQISQKPGTTPEAREDQLIAAAMNLAEQQILDGTASPSVITHFLKLGSPDARMERQKLEEEVKLLKAKTEQLESMQKREELYAEAIKAMQLYNPIGDENPEDEIL